MPDAPNLFNGENCELTDRQTQVYADLFDIWDVDRDPERTDQWLRIAVGVPGHYEFTPNYDLPTEGGRIRDFSVLTTDVLHLPLLEPDGGPSIPNGGWVVNVTGGNPNQYVMHHILGDPQILPGTVRRPLNKQSIDVGQDETPPAYLVSFYGLDAS